MSCRNNRLLVIDDELGWCRLLKSGLEENNFEVKYETEAENAIKAIKSICPHAVILDVIFGNTSKGTSTFRNIKKEFPGLTVIMLTSTVADQDFRLEDYPDCAFAYAKYQLSSGMDDVYVSLAEKIRRAIKNAESTTESLQAEFDFIIGKTKAVKRSVFGELAERG